MSSRALALIGALCASAALAGQPGAPPDVPAVVRSRCLTCHGMDLIEQQRLGRAGWEREVDKMIRWGAVVPDAERQSLIDSLAARTGSQPSTADHARGAEVLSRRCLTCHGTDLVEQQRLSANGWRREVDKMAGWGARLEPDEKDPLVAYLADRFGVR